VVNNQYFNQALYHLYINPLEQCNLRCKICYTKKTAPILTEKQIKDFIDRYQLIQPLKIITFCGGEVFTLPYFPALVNYLTENGLFIQIITNGTIDRLDKLKNPNSINLIVSVDGLKDYHDKNRGEGSFRKSIDFIAKANRLRFHTEIFSIVTEDNFPQITEFEKDIKNTLGDILITYHPRKTRQYLSDHPFSNIIGAVDGFGFVTARQMSWLYKNKTVFPPEKLGCYQIALMSDGKIYGCCEGTEPIGDIGDSIDRLIESLKQRVCLGCAYPKFMCGISSVIPDYS